MPTPTSTGSTSSSRQTRPMRASCSTPPRIPRPSATREERHMKIDKLSSTFARRPLAELEQHRGFVDRHIGTTDADQAAMLKTLGYASRAALIAAIVPPAIRDREALALP